VIALSSFHVVARSRLYAYFWVPIVGLFSDPLLNRWPLKVIFFLGGGDCRAYSDFFKTKITLFLGRRCSWEAVYGYHLKIQAKDTHLNDPDWSGSDFSWTSPDDWYELCRQFHVDYRSAFQLALATQTLLAHPFPQLAAISHETKSSQRSINSHTPPYLRTFATHLRLCTKQINKHGYMSVGGALCR